MARSKKKPKDRKIDKKRAELAKQRAAKKRAHEKLVKAELKALQARQKLGPLPRPLDEQEEKTAKKAREIKSPADLAEEIIHSVQRLIKESESVGKATSRTNLRCQEWAIKRLLRLVFGREPTRDEVSFVTDDRGYIRYKDHDAYDDDEDEEEEDDIDADDDEDAEGDFDDSDYDDD